MWALTKVESIVTDNKSVTKNISKNSQKIYFDWESVKVEGSELCQGLQFFFSQQNSLNFPLHPKDCNSPVFAKTGLSLGWLPG